jgi:hypothetical protein
MPDRLSPRQAFDFTYEELHKNRDLGKLSERQLAEFREKIAKPRLIIGVYAVLIMVAFVLTLLWITPKVWLIFPCGICGSSLGVVVWFGYEYFIDSRTEGESVSVIKNVPKSHIKKLRYPIDDFSHRIELEKFRALFTPDQYDSLDDGLSYDFYYKPTDYFQGDYRVFSVDQTWTPARTYRVMVWRNGLFKLREIYDLDLDPTLHPDMLPEVLAKTAFHAKGYLETHYEEIDTTQSNVEWFMLHMVSIGLFAFGQLDAAEDALLSFNRLDPKSTYYKNVSVPLMLAVRDLLPIPKDLFALNHLDKTIIWLKENRDRLEWNETKGKFGLRKV